MEKNFEICSFGISKESKNIVLCGDFLFSKVFMVVEFLWIIVCGGIVVVLFVEFLLFGIKVVEFGIKNILGI